MHDTEFDPTTIPPEEVLSSLDTLEPVVQEVVLDITGYNFRDFTEGRDPLPNPSRPDPPPSSGIDIAALVDSARIRPHLCGSTEVQPVVSIEQWRREREEREAQAATNSAGRYLGTMEGAQHLKLSRRLRRRNARLQHQGFLPEGPGVA